MDVCVDGELIGRIVYELFKNLCPETCANFIALCTGEKGHSSTTNTRLSYVNSIFHRVVVNGWVQGGGMSHNTMIPLLLISTINQIFVKAVVQLESQYLVNIFQVYIYDQVFTSILASLFLS